MSNTNKPASSGTQEKLNSSSFSWTDEEGNSILDRDAAFQGGPTPKFTQLWGDWMVSSYQFVEDGSNGLMITNGSTIFHMDNTGNMIFGTGDPSQGGCGGKLILNTASQMQKAKTVAVEVTGDDEDGKTEEKSNDDGNSEEVKVPAYSLKVYGEIAIESVGGEVTIGGDNITLNAKDTLALKAGKSILLQAGEKGGNIDMNAGKVKIDCAYYDKTISGGEYSTGAGESDITQILPGSTITEQTVGSIKQVVTGDIELGAVGEIKLGSTTFHQQANLDMGIRALKDLSISATGKSKMEVLGTVSEKEAKAPGTNFEIFVGPGKSPTKETPAFKLSSGGAIGMESLFGGYKFTSGAKATSEFGFDEKVGEWRVGLKLGSVGLGVTDAALRFGVKPPAASEVKVGPALVEITATAIYLN